MAHHSAIMMEMYILKVFEKTSQTLVATGAGSKSGQAGRQERGNPSRVRCYFDGDCRGCSPFHDEEQARYILAA